MVFWGCVYFHNFAFVLRFRIFAAIKSDIINEQQKNNSMNDMAQA